MSAPLAADAAIFTRVFADRSGSLGLSLSTRVGLTSSWLVSGEETPCSVVL